MQYTPLEVFKPKFIKLDIREDHTYYVELPSIENADGVQFLCPKCYLENNGSVGTHMIMCWQPHIPQTVSPKPGRWKFHGTGLHDLTLVAGSSSVFLKGDGCKAHFFIKKGEVQLM